MNVTVFVMRTVGDITSYCSLHTDKGTANERYSVSYEEGWRIVQCTVNCTQTEELQQNVTLFVMRMVGG
jgi:hypothetical protein